MSDWRQRLATTFAEAAKKQSDEAHESRTRREREVGFAREFLRPGAELFVQELKRTQNLKLDPDIDDAGSGVDVRVHGYPGAWMEARVTGQVFDERLRYSIEFYFHDEFGYQRHHGNNYLSADAGGRGITPQDVAEKFSNLYLERVSARRRPGRV